MRHENCQHHRLHHGPAPCALCPASEKKACAATYQERTRKKATKFHHGLGGKSTVARYLTEERHGRATCTNCDSTAASARPNLKSKPTREVESFFGSISRFHPSGKDTTIPIPIPIPTEKHFRSTGSLTFETSHVVTPYVFRQNGSYILMRLLGKSLRPRRGLRTNAKKIDSKLKIKRREKKQRATMVKPDRSQTHQIDRLDRRGGEGQSEDLRPASRRRGTSVSWSSPNMGVVGQGGRGDGASDPSR